MERVVPAHGFGPRSAGAFAGMLLLALVVIAAIVAPLLAPFDPLEQDRQSFLVPPAWAAEIPSDYVLGTDAAGRDLLSRTLHGARISLLFSGLAVAMALIAGTCAGLVAALWPGWRERFLLRGLDILQSFPPLLFGLIVLTILGPGTLPALVALAVVLLPGFARLTRAATLAELGKEYSLAARALGGSKAHLVRWSILPNIGGLLLVQCTLALSEAILGFAALGFLGLGVRSPTPEWGTMLAEGRPYVAQAWWTVVVPGVAIVVTVLSLNLIAEGLRRTLEHKTPVARL